MAITPKTISVRVLLKAVEDREERTFIAGLMHILLAIVTVSTHDWAVTFFLVVMTCIGAYNWYTDHKERMELDARLTNGEQ